MKRFLFWFVVVLLAVALIRANHRPKPIPSWHGPRIVVSDGHVPRVLVDGPGRRVVVTDRDGKVVKIDGRGVLITKPDRDRDRDRDGDDDRDNEAFDDDRGPTRVEVEGLPVPVVPGSRVTEARIEPPKAPAPPRPPRRPR